jgi:hypothetical protein
VTALLAGKMLFRGREVPTASGRSQPGPSWQSEVGDETFIVSSREVEGVRPLVKVSSAKAWPFQEAPRRPKDACPSSDKHTSERKYLWVVNLG